MPRTPKKPSGESSSLHKPYPSTPDKTESKASMRGNINGGKGTAWTGEELIELFRFAMDRNGRDWGVAVQGRTANQARQTWTKSILPFIEKSLLERGGAGAGD